MITTMNEKLKKTWDYIVSECGDMWTKSINVGGHIRRAAVIAAAEELERNEEFFRWLTMNGWDWGPLTEAWHKGHDESNFEDVVKAWKTSQLGKEATE